MRFSPFPARFFCKAPQKFSKAGLQILQILQIRQILQKCCFTASRNLWMLEDAWRTRRVVLTVLPANTLQFLRTFQLAFQPFITTVFEIKWHESSVKHFPYHALVKHYWNYLELFPCDDENVNSFGNWRCGARGGGGRYACIIFT